VKEQPVALAEQVMEQPEEHLEEQGIPHLQNQQRP